MIKEKVSIFNKMINIFKNNIRNIKDERRQRSDLKYSYTDKYLFIKNPNYQKPKEITTDFVKNP